jgi:hypothetical protein
MRFVLHRRDDCWGYRAERMMNDAYYSSSRYALILLASVSQLRSELGSWRLNFLRS